MRVHIAPTVFTAVVMLVGCVSSEQTKTQITGSIVMKPEMKKFNTYKCGQHTVSMYGVRRISLAEIEKEKNFSHNQETVDFLVVLEAPNAEIRSVEYKTIDANYYGEVEAVRVLPNGQREAFIDNPSDISGPDIVEDQWSEAVYDAGNKTFSLELWQVGRFFSGVNLIPGTYRWREKPIGTVRINGAEECQFPMGVYEFTITP